MLGIDYLVAGMMEKSVCTILRVFLLILSFLLAAVSIYALALQARYENTVRNTLKNAWILTFAMLPYTLMILILTIGPVVMTSLTMKTIVIGFTIWLFAGVSLVAWLNSILLRKEFERLEQRQNSCNA